MADRLIHILPEQVASQIAAGEVVERPASAVKELVENSLDAGARSISVEISRGGGSLIAVSDDGCGMGRHDAILSVRRHATSKIITASDLSRVRTLGFRGEALASISSVSRMELKTRRPQDDSGVHLSLVGGEVSASQDFAMAPGTRVEVHDLFFNTPARLKFLKTVVTEQSAIFEALQRLALGNYGAAFSLTADGRELLDVARAGTLLERTRQLFGAKLAARMLPFKLEADSARVSGLASVSQDSFPTARMIFTFVNHRSVRDRLLARAVSQAYTTLLPRGRHPSVALFIDMRPEDVDVNVHPMKTEVRFKRSNSVFEVVYHALRDRLSDQTSTELVEHQRHSSPPPSSPQQSSQQDVPPENPAPEASGSPFQQPSSGQTLPTALRLVSDGGLPRPSEQRALGLSFGKSGTGLQKSGTGLQTYDSSTAQPGSPADNYLSRSKPVPIYSNLRVLGQLFAGYVVLESDDGLLLVDQHAAHERVTFEKLRAELRNGGVKVQARLVPEVVELSPARAAQVNSALPRLAALGFDAELFGPASLLLKGTPAVFGPSAGSKLLSDMIESMAEGDWARHGEEAFENLLKQLACHGSVRVGRVLEDSEIHALLAELDQTEFKTNCPHGRPVHIAFPRGQIERMFRR